MWGLDDETAEEFSNIYYGVKFDFQSGSPGYIGDLFILQGDGLSADPAVLIRDETTSSLKLVTF